VVDFTRKHTAKVQDGLTEIRRIIEMLVDKRNQRRDAFVRVLTRAMSQTLGPDAESVTKELLKHGIPRTLARNAIEIARQQGRFTIFSLVDALTRLTQKVKFVGDRTESDAKVAALLALAA
jgi:predicted GNAT family acetyltransferase